MSSRSSPVRIQRQGSGTSSISGSPTPTGRPRYGSIARLSSPTLGSSHRQTPPVAQVPTPQQIASDQRHETSFAALENPSSLPRPGQSALSAALASSPAGSRSRDVAYQGDDVLGTSAQDRNVRTNYGSIDTRQLAGSPGPVHDPEIVRRHLVQPDETRSRKGSGMRLAMPDPDLSDEDEFSSLRLQGGDMTRAVYRWAEDADRNLRRGQQRSKSFMINRPEPESDTLDIQNIRVPGGFRRNFIRRVAGSPVPHNSQYDGPADDNGREQDRQRPQLFTNNFLEFLTLYGHFAGEDLEEDDEVLGPDEYFPSDAFDGNADGDGEETWGEDSALLTPGTKRRRKHKERPPTGKHGAFNATLLLLKSFVGTGVLFLPRAFLNGGMLFSSLLLLAVAILSYYCFILLVETRLKVDGSFGDIGGVLYGKWMRTLILASLVLGQIGFVAAYTVFTAENLQAFVLAVTDCRKFIDIKFLILAQLVVFLPLALIRDIGKLGFTALVADAFILLGLVYLYYYDIGTLAWNHGPADITLFNPSTWTLFVGTALFTFEGVGLILPIQESMRKPTTFPSVLAVVMIIITVIFTSIGVLSYAAFGSKTQTVVLLNLPQGNKLVNAVQFLYSVAILLSTPLQLFPAIRIMENEFFSRSGKYNPYIKWQKNVFRFFFVMGCALIAFLGANDLDKFVSLVGSFACLPLVYVYPPLLHLRAVEMSRIKRIGDYALCIFGMVACLYTTIQTIHQWAGSSSKRTHGYCDS